MLLPKLLLLLSSLGSNVGFFEHESPSRMIVCLTPSQMETFLKKQEGDEQIKRSINNYVESYFQDEGELYKLIINFNKFKSPTTQEIVYNHPYDHPEDVQEGKEELADAIYPDDLEFTTEEYVD